MYCDGYMAPDATMPVLSFIADQLLPESVCGQKRRLSTDRPSLLALEDFSRLLDPLITRPLPKESKNLWQAFVTISWRIDNLDMLFDFFQSMSLLFEERKSHASPEEAGVPHVVLKKASLLGAFVRRAMLEFERLIFHDAVALWQDYERFRAPAHPKGLYERPFADLDPSPSSTVSQILHRGVEVDKTSASQASSGDVERLLIFQVEQMQSTYAYSEPRDTQADFAQELGVRLPQEIEERFESILRPSAEVSSLSNYAKYGIMVRIDMKTDTGPAGSSIPGMLGIILPHLITFIDTMTMLCITRADHTINMLCLTWQSSMQILAATAKLCLRCKKR